MFLQSAQILTRTVTQWNLILLASLQFSNEKIFWFWVCFEVLFNFKCIGWSQGSELQCSNDATMQCLLRCLFKIDLVCIFNVCATICAVEYEKVYYWNLSLMFSCLSIYVLFLRVIMMAALKPLMIWTSRKVSWEKSMPMVLKNHQLFSKELLSHALMVCVMFHYH